MRLRDRRKLATILIVQDVSHRRLAEAAGWRSHSIVGRLLRGELTTVEPKRALRIARFLGLPVEDLFAVQVTGETGQTDQRKRERVA